MRSHAKRHLRAGLSIFGLLAGALVVASCGDNEVAPDASEPADAARPDATLADAGFGDDASISGPNVRVGTGQDEFRALATNERVEFFMGPQSNGDPVGGFHIWGAVRGLEVDPVGTTVGFTVLSQDGTQTLGASAARRVTLLPDGTGGYQGYGFPAILDDCCAVRDRPLILRVTVTDGAQMVLRDEIEVLGATACRTGTGTNVCP